MELKTQGTISRICTLTEVVKIFLGETGEMRQQTHSAVSGRVERRIGGQSALQQLDRLTRIQTLARVTRALRWEYQRTPRHELSGALTRAVCQIASSPDLDSNRQCAQIASFLERFLRKNSPRASALPANLQVASLLFQKVQEGLEAL